MDAPEEVDYSGLPIEERVVHKIWKVRLEAYNSLKTDFDNSGSEEDDCFNIFLKRTDLLKKIVADSNVIAQESGIAMLASFLKYGGQKACLSTRETIIPILCEKSLASMRQGTKENTLECLLLYIELDTAQPVIDLIIPSLSARLPKLVTGAVKALNDCYSAFGCKAISPKSTLGVIPKLFQHTDKNVRAETTNLSITLRSWMGDSFDSIIFPELKKDVQRNDLTAAFQKIEGPKQPTRILKSQQKSLASATSSTNGSGGAASEDVEMENVSTIEESIDPYDMVDPVDVLSKIPADFESRLSMSIWKERVGVLEEYLKEIANVKKVPNKDYGDLIRSMSRCMKDANLQVVTLACSITLIVANGLRDPFQKYVHLIFPQVLERTKEKKQSVLDALHSVLYACFQYSSLSDVFDSTLTNMVHKNPQIRIESLKFMVKCLQNTGSVPKKTEIDLLMEGCIKLLKDSQAPVRNLSSEVIGTLMKITGERRMNPFIKDLGDLHKSKIKEFYDNAQVKASGASVSDSSTDQKQPDKASIPAKKSIPTSSASARNGATSTASTVAKRTLGSTKLGNPSTLPSKRGPPSPTKVNEQPTRLGNALTSRTLNSHSSLLPAPGVSATSLSVDRRELMELRGEREKWNIEKETYEARIREFQLEKEKFLNEIKNLNDKNTQLRGEITNLSLNFKNKDIQIQRLTNDLDRSTNKLRELEAISLESKSSTSLSPIRHENSNILSPNSRIGISPIRFNGSNTTSTINAFDSMGISLGHNSDLSSRVSGLTINPKFNTANNNDPQKENLPKIHSGGSPPKAFMTSPFNTNMYETEVTEDIWKRTAEVSDNLRRRIQMMKEKGKVPSSDAVADGGAQ